MQRPKRRAFSRDTLRRTASLVFALTTILPLLMFGYTLHRVNGMRDVQDQIVFGLALAVALLGFYILRVMVSRVSDVLRAASEASRQGRVAPLVAEKDLQVPVVGPMKEFHGIASPSTVSGSAGRPR